MNAYLNRELSWLKFNERVLEEAESREVPLCERLNFASIYQSNLDEFFMVRVGSLMDQMLLSKNLRDNKTHMTAEEQIKAIGKTVTRLNRRKDAVYAELMEHLEGYGVRLVNFQKLGSRESGELERYFDTEIAPLTSPTTVSRRQPFPFLQNKENLRSGGSGRKKRAGKARDYSLRHRGDSPADWRPRTVGGVYAVRGTDSAFSAQGIQRLPCGVQVPDPGHPERGH